jgi:hypothetical protein
MKHVEYSVNVNNELTFKDNYNNLKITEDWMNIVKVEFERISEYIKSYKAKDKEKFDYNELLKNLKINKENMKNITYPSQEAINYLSVNINNKMCMKLIKHFTSLFDMDSPNKYNISMWIYYLFCMLERPLVDEDNATLYGFIKKLHKYISTNKDSIEIDVDCGRILYVIINEIFKQKLVSFY